MYTDALRIQQPHRPHTSGLQHRYHESYNTSQDLSLPRMGNSHGHNRMQNASFRQRLQQQQQQQQQRKIHQHAAHPISSTLPLHSSAEGGGTADVDETEHMLRRKTPNGTLAAGYDGRSTEPATRLHATKHVLVPASRTIESTSFSRAQLPEHPYIRPLGSAHSTEAPREHQHHYHGSTVQPLHTSKKSVGRGRNTDIAPEAGPLADFGAGVDSVLNQALTLQQCQMYGNNHDVPTVLQPMWPPCLGSTAMNHCGPYGPYWPDGAFEPYRPAPLRDTRYAQQSRGGVVSSKSPMDLGLRRYQDWSHEEPASQHHLPIGPTRSHIPNHYRSDLLPFKSVEECRSTKWSRQSEVVSHDTSARSGCNDLENRFGGAGSAPAPSGEPLDMLIRTNKAHFKEKVLVWAHQTYINLVASLHQTRGSGLVGNLRGERHFLPSVFPKPPGHPLLHPTTRIRLESQLEPLDARQSACADYMDVDTDTHFPPTSHSSSSLSATNSLSEISRDPWSRRTDTKRRTGQQQNQSIQLPQQPGSSFRPVLFQENISFTLPEFSSPSTAALSALEMLSKLCHESGWQWIDGMLLGGCLAYGLDDHIRAMEWYSKVLACDPRRVLFPTFAKVAHSSSVMSKLFPI